MRITGSGVWGPPKDRGEAIRVCPLISWASGLVGRLAWADEGNHSRRPTHPAPGDASPGYSGRAAMLHDLLSIPTFLALPAGAAVHARSADAYTSLAERHVS